MDTPRISNTKTKPVIRIRWTPNAREVARVLSRYHIPTVCEEALCPNILECWGSKSVTFMILGDTCTRGCRFCSVKRGKPSPLDPGEPERIAEAVAELGLRYVTITSVTRDDLPDSGASHYARVVEAVKKKSPSSIVEVLTPDFNGDPRLVELVARSGVDVYAHNLETVRRLTPLVRDPRAGYDKSLSVLEAARDAVPGIVLKSSILLGLGEDIDEVHEAIRDLAGIGLDILVLSQYLRPTPRQIPVKKLYKISEFRELREYALSKGVKYVLAHPLARTSYKAWEAYREVLKSRRGGEAGVETKHNI